MNTHNPQTVINVRFLGEVGGFPPKHNFPPGKHTSRANRFSDGEREREKDVSKDYLSYSSWNAGHRNIRTNTYM